MLCYAQNERSNIIERDSGYVAFENNVSKRFIEAISQISIIVSYESVRRSRVHEIWRLGGCTNRFQRDVINKLDDIARTEAETLRHI